MFIDSFSIHSFMLKRLLLVSNLPHRFTSVKASEVLGYDAKSEVNQMMNSGLCERVNKGDKPAIYELTDRAYRHKRAFKELLKKSPCG